MPVTNKSSHSISSTVPELSAGVKSKAVAKPRRSRTASRSGPDAIATEQKYCAPNYLPLPVTLVRGKGVYLWDQDDNRYLDMMSAYSAVSHGHCNPRLVAALTDQAEKLTIVSRAFHTDKLAPFAEKICGMTGFDKMLPMNTGAEAVETAIKAARRWG